MSPKQRERICQWSHQFASGKKIFLAKLCKCTKKLTSSPDGDARMRTKTNPPHPRKKSKGFLTKPKKSLHKNYPPPPSPEKEKNTKRDLVPGYRHRTRILAWVCLKKECVHISAQRVPYFGTKCERCITFPHTTKEIGRLRECSLGELPLYFSRNFNSKLSSILYTQTQRHLQVYPNLSYHCILCSGRRKEEAFVPTNCCNWNPFKSWQR